MSNPFLKKAQKNSKITNKAHLGTGKDIGYKEEIPQTIEGQLHKLQELHIEINSLAIQTLHKALKAGEILICIKKSRNKDWQKWSQTNLPFSLSTAKRYMRVYKKRNEIPQNINNMTEAYKFLTQSQDSKPISKEKDLNPIPTPEYPKPKKIITLLKEDTQNSKSKVKLWYDSEEKRLNELLDILKIERDKL